VTIGELANYSADDLSHHLSGRVYLVSKFLAIAGVLLCWMPFVGLGIGIAGVLANLRTVGWPRTMSWIGTILSSLIMIAFLVLLAFQ